MAICWEQGEAARLLLQLGADPNQVGVPGSTRRGLEAQEREMAFRSATFVANLGAGFACVHRRSRRLFCQQMAWPLLLFTLGWCCPEMQLLEPHNNGGYYQIFSETSGAEEVGPLRQEDAAA